MKISKFKLIFFSFMAGILLANTNKIKDETIKYFAKIEQEKLGYDFKVEGNSMDVTVKTVLRFNENERTAGFVKLKNDRLPTIFFQNGKILSQTLSQTNLHAPNLFFSNVAGVKSVMAIDGEIYFLYTSVDQKKCYRVAISNLDGQQVSLQGDCLNDFDGIDFNGVGGGWAAYGKKTFLAIGAPEGFSPIIRTLAQDPSSLYGKVWLIEKSNSSEKLEKKLFATGFRNPQGLSLHSELGLFSVEHGPRGGDEINLVKQNNNYGWPKVSYGATYGGQVENNGSSIPYPDDHISKGFTEPLYSFVPSIGLSNVSACPKFIYDGHCIILLSLKQSTVYIVRFAWLDKKKSAFKVVSVEPIVETPHRLRHFALNTDGTLYVDGNSFYITADRHGVLKLSFEKRYKPNRILETNNKISPAQSNLSSLALAGEQVYRLECMSCHNLNPQIEGSIGPALISPSMSLLKNKVLKGEYPFFYSPKRTTQIMPALPYLKNDIKALHSYLNQL